MPTDLLIQLMSQLGISGILLWMLLDERKARQGLETRVFKYLEDERTEAHEQTRPHPPTA